jgi:starch synthase
MVPLAKTGGLGDVCGALPIALDQAGVRCTAFLPAFRSVTQSGLALESTPYSFTIPIARKYVACRLLKTRLPNSQVDVYLVDQPQYFDRGELYSDANGEYRDNCERFCFYSRAVAEAIHQLGLKVDILHCHDWQTGLLPAYVATNYRNYPWLEQSRSIMTIHNLAYQGKYWHLDMPLTDMSWDYFNWQQMEFHGDLNLLKTGIVFADRVTTVSPTYAREITTPEYGCGLEGVLADRGSQLVGIVNGVDYNQWNPATDPHLESRYDNHHWRSGKAACKAWLQGELGLSVRPDVPLIGIVSRLVDQKGWDLIIPMLSRWAENPDVQWAILGTGDPKYQENLRQLSEKHPDNLAVRLGFSEPLAHQIEAGSDIFLMPSRYEPCGLNQLYSLKYGSVPVVTRTGGLADTVTDTTTATLQDRSATGFVCDHYSVSSLEETLSRSLELYLHQNEIWGQIVATGMEQDWSWSSSAHRYLEVYEEVLKEAR